MNLLSLSHSNSDANRENPIHVSQHVPEMHEIAVEEIERLVPNMIQRECVRYINIAIKEMIGALRYDIETTIEIAFKDLGTLYKDKKTQKYISDTVMRAIENRLNNITIKMEL